MEIQATKMVVTVVTILPSESYMSALLTQFELLIKTIWYLLRVIAGLIIGMVYRL